MGNLEKYLEENWPKRAKAKRQEPQWKTLAVEGPSWLGLCHVLLN